MTRINSLYGSQTSPVVLSMQNNVINIVSMGPSLHLWILHAKQRLLDQNYKSLWVPALTCGFCMQNSVFWIRITSLYGSKPSSVVFACKTATLASELLVSMGPRPHLWFFSFKTATLAPELQVSMCPRPHLRFCACKTTWLASEILVSMWPSPNLWFLHAKQRLKDQN